MDYTLTFFFSALLIIIIIGGGYLIYRRLKVTKIKPAAGNHKIVFPKSPRFDYEFSNGEKCFQKEMNGEQILKLADLWLSIDMTKYEEKNKVRFYVNALIKYKLLDDFFAILFGNEEVKFAELHYSEIERVLTDFFLLNPLARIISDILQIVSDLQTKSLLSRKTANGSQKTGSVSVN